MIDRAGINQLKCPKCGELIPVSETIYHQIEEEARQNVNAEFAQQQSLIGEREQRLKEREDGFDKTIQDLCVPKTLSELMPGWNRLSWRNDGAALFRSGLPDLAIQV